MSILHPGVYNMDTGHLLLLPLKRCVVGYRPNDDKITIDKIQDHAPQSREQKLSISVKTRLELVKFCLRCPSQGNMGQFWGD